MKTSDLQGVALDWAVLKIEWMKVGGIVIDASTLNGVVPNYSTGWSEGGEIISRERISIVCQQGSPEFWLANCPRAKHHGYGETALIAAMRCYVASKLGDEVTIPEGLN